MANDPTEVSSNDADVYLQDLVAMIARTDKTIPVVLCVGGAVITGNLVSGRKYFESGSADEAGRPPEVGEAVRAWLKLYTDEADDPAISNCVHVSDAKVMTGGTTFILKGGGMWRGRISKVDGFAVGRAEVTDGR